VCDLVTDELAPRTGARRGPYDHSAIITVISKSNPHRAGSKDHGKFRKIKTGMTVKEALEAGADRRYLRYATEMIESVPAAKRENCLQPSASLQAQREQTEKMLEEARGRLDSLRANRENALEQARKDFLVEVKVLVNSVNDRTVLYLMADCALEECRTREIGVEAFESWTDKEEAKRILTDLHLAKNSVSDEDRQEATRYRGLRSLREELTLAGRQFLNETREANKKKIDLYKLRNKLQQEITKLQRDKGGWRTRTAKSPAGFVR